MKAKRRSNAVCGPCAMKGGDGGVRTRFEARWVVHRESTFICGVWDLYICRDRVGCGRFGQVTEALSIYNAKQEKSNRFCGWCNHGQLARKFIKASR